MDSGRGRGSGSGQPRGSGRGGRGGRGRGGPGGGRGGGYGPRGGRGGSAPGAASGRPPTQQYQQKESILDLSKYMDQKIRVKFSGGREVIGVLKGWDKLVNIVLDEGEEFLREETRPVGLVVCRGTAVIHVSPMEGQEEIENPFLEQQ